MAEKARHSIDATQLLKELATDPHHGLASDEATKRLERYGHNELTKEKGISPSALLFNQFKDVLIIILLVAVVLSVVVGECVDAAILGVRDVSLQSESDRTLRRIGGNALSEAGRLSGVIHDQP